VQEPIISVSGLRGVVGKSLTPEVALRYAAAFSAETPAGPFVITRDGRPSGAMLAEAVHVGLAAVGRSTIDAGVAATPTTGVLIRHHRAAGGIQISASHNPAEYNGMKLFDAGGRVIPAASGQQVLDRYRSGEVDWEGHGRLAAFEECSDSLSAHLEAVLATVDVERICAQSYKVVLDSNHGAGSLLGRRLLEALGCEVTVLGGQPDGQFEHPPEPTAENLAGVRSQIRRFGADVGFCQDPDADRLAVIDASGRYLGEEYTLAMCVDHVLRQKDSGFGVQGSGGRASGAARRAIVTNCATSRMSADLAARYGAAFFRSAVGEANVVDAMLAHDALFGGEGNGGPIDPRVGLVRDSFVGMAQLLDAMAARGLPIARLADELPRYRIEKTKITLAPEKVAAGLDALERHFLGQGARADRLDGLRLDWPDRWLLVRPSNTEPIVRAIAEAESETEAKRLCAEAAEVLDSSQ